MSERVDNAVRAYNRLDSLERQLGSAKVKLDKAVEGMTPEEIDEYTRRTKAVVQDRKDEGVR